MTSQTLSSCTAQSVVRMSPGSTVREDRHVVPMFTDDECADFSSASFPTLTIPLVITERRTTGTKTEKKQTTTTTTGSKPMSSKMCGCGQESEEEETSSQVE